MPDIVPVVGAKRVVARAADQDIDAVVILWANVPARMARTLSEHEPTSRMIRWLSSATLEMRQRRSVDATHVAVTDRIPGFDIAPPGTHSPCPGLGELSQR